tara:strand:- start:4606 stop:4758 length:153 start_codon:yes stop_codon:yes gene_type:complete
MDWTENLPLQASRAISFREEGTAVGALRRFLTLPQAFLNLNSMAIVGMAQ